MIERLKVVLGAIGISVLLLIGIELAARSTILIRDAVVSPENTTQADPEFAVFFEHAEYDVERLVSESSQVKALQFQPYALWNRTPFQGELITIQEDGTRATRFNSSREDALQIWAFGGSTMWGAGTPDAGTIPSQLANFLNEEWGVDSRVRNLGEGAYVSTQEVISLVRQLQLGNRPDVVIFYDGANDAGAAWSEPETPGAHGRMNRFRAQLKGSDPDPSPFAQLITDSGTFRVAMFALRKLGVELQAAAEDDTVESQGLGEFALQVTVEAYRTVDALAAAYGFDTLFFFQPILGGGEKPLHEAEEPVLERGRQIPPVQWTMEVYADHRRAIQAYDGSPLVIHDLSDVFKGVTEPIFFDWFHISDRGNLIVAESIFETLRAQLCESAPPNASSRVRNQIAERCS